MSRVIGIQRALRMRSKPRSWVYLGKDVRVRGRLAARWGASAEFNLGDRLDTVARGLRKPFADGVARLGARQKDPISWWQSNFSWKLPGASDLFLLTCYHELIGDLLSVADPEFVVVEDPWLMKQCAVSYPETASWSLRDAGWLAATKARLFARSIPARLLWLARRIRMRSRQRSLSRVPAQVSPGAPLVLLYGLPHERCFRDPSRWNDPFLYGLEEILERNSFRVAHLAPPVAGFEEELARRGPRAIPMILHAESTTLLACLPLPRPPEGASGFKVGPSFLPILAEREWWTDIATAWRCEVRLFHRMAQRSLRLHRPRAVVVPYENQPWEKMLVLACRELDIRTIGHQHSVTSRYFLPVYPGEGGTDTTPMPDVILAAGPTMRDCLIEGGNDPGRVLVSGSLRMASIRLGDTRERVRERLSGDRKRRVLVIVCHDPAVAYAMLHDLEASFPTHGSDEGVEFHLRPHPTFDALGPTVYSWMPRLGGDLAPQLDRFDAVLSSSSTAVLEVLARGMPVVIYRPETVLDVNDMTNYLPPALGTPVSKQMLRSAILDALAGGRKTAIQDVLATWSSLFAPVDESVWLRELHRPPQTRAAAVAEGP